MIFVSKYSRLSVPVLHEKKKHLGHNQFGESDWELVVPHFCAEFAPTLEGGPALLSRDRLAAFRYFGGAPDHGIFAGSSPRSDGYSDQVGAYEASREEWNLGVFDTESEKCIPADLAEFRERIEARLCEKGEEQRWTDFVKIGVAVLEPPWPKYEETHHNSIAGIVKNQGYNVADVLAYEHARESPRRTVIEQLEALVTEQAAAAKDEAALEVTIGG